MKFPKRGVICSLITVSILASCGRDEKSEPAPSSQPDTTSMEETGELPRLTASTFAKVDQPIAVTERSQGEDIVFVIERAGRISMFDRSGKSLGVALDISDQTTTDGERGLLGLAFMQSDTEGWFAYVNYTNDDGDTVIAEFRTFEDGTFDESSQRILMTVDQPYANHNGGAILAADDGTLLIGMGDGGAGGDPERHALNLSSLLGKVLRIDPTPSGSAQYSIPADNPFAEQSDARPEIWSYGLRNPWRMSLNGDDLWIADVGQSNWEEINFAKATSTSVGGRGANFGWSAFEAFDRYNQDQSDADHTEPIFAYSHEDGRCSISGGAVVTTQIEALAGTYLFSDYCSGKIYALTDGSNENYEMRELSKSLGRIVAVNATSDAIYAVNIKGKVLELKVAD